MCLPWHEKVHMCHGHIIQVNERAVCLMGEKTETTTDNITHRNILRNKGGGGRR
jgi:hypothetical protein